MQDIHALPIPDWGLGCPRCDAPLTGLTEYRCRQCGQAFDIVRVLSAHRPVAAIGLTCEQCGYLLTGLTDDRCPECGAEFCVWEMLDDREPEGFRDSLLIDDPPDHHIKKREPVFTGHERPLPEFGFACTRCGSSLAGATADACPVCGTPFDLSRAAPRRLWADISSYVPEAIGPIARTVLYAAQIPYLVDNQGLNRIYGVNIPFVSRRLRAPRDFFFDALYAFAAATEQRAGGGRDWDCATCGEPVPGGFEICWKCGSPQPECYPSDTTQE